MRNVIILLIIFLFNFCGVSESEHNKVLNELTEKNNEIIKLKNEVESLKKEIEEIKFGADRLLKNSKNHFSNKQYNKSKRELELLLKKHPTSDESKEGKILLVKVTTIIKRIKKEKELAEKRKLDIVLKRMRKNYDKVNEITWYQDRYSPRNLRRKGFYIYLGRIGKGKPWLRMIVQYSASDWLFIKEFRIKVNGNIFSITPKSYSEFKRDHGSGAIWEWVDRIVGKNEMNIIKEIENAKTVILRYVGNKYFVDKTLTGTELQSFKNVMTVYRKFGGD